MAAIPREKLANQLVDAFRQYGYDGASLTCLAKATGLGKTNLYHYFPGGKQEMAEVALAQVQGWLTESILRPLAGPMPPEDRLRDMCDQVSRFFRDGQNSCLWAVLALGQTSHDLFHREVKHGLSSWIRAIATVLEEGGIDGELARVRAQEAVLRIQGALVLARGLDDTEPFLLTIEALPPELLKRN